MTCWGKRCSEGQLKLFRAKLGFVTESRLCGVLLLAVLLVPHSTNKCNFSSG